jgi:hypothetical protein
MKELNRVINGMNEKALSRLFKFIKMKYSLF